MIRNIYIHWPLYMHTHTHTHTHTPQSIQDCHAFFQPEPEEIQLYPDVGPKVCTPNISQATHVLLPSSKLIILLCKVVADIYHILSLGFAYKKKI